MQPCFRRRRGAQEPGFGRQIDDPNRFAGAPNLADKPFAAGEHPLAADGIEFRALEIRRAPHDIAPQRSGVAAAFPIKAPERAPVPFQVFADRPKHLRRGAGEAVGLGQDPRHGKLRCDALVAAPALGDVDGHHGKECWSVFHRGYTRRADVRPNDRTVLASIALFKAIAGLLARYDAGEKPPRFVAIVLVRKFE